MTTATKATPPLRIRRTTAPAIEASKEHRPSPAASPAPKPVPQAKPRPSAPKGPAKPPKPPTPAPAPVQPAAVAKSKEPTPAIACKFDLPDTTKLPEPKPVKSRSRYRWSKPGRTGAQIWEQPGRDALAAEPQTYQPDGKPILFGALRLFYLPRLDRPVLVVEVSGDHTRWVPWRFDWPVSPDTACLVETSPGKQAWIKLQPRTMAEHQDVWLAGKIALEAWSEARKQRKARKDQPQ